MRRDIHHVRDMISRNRRQTQFTVYSPLMAGKIFQKILTKINNYQYNGLRIRQLAKMEHIYD